MNEFRTAQIIDFASRRAQQPILTQIEPVSGWRLCYSLNGVNTRTVTWGKTRSEINALVPPGAHFVTMERV